MTKDESKEGPAGENKKLNANGSTNATNCCAGFGGFGLAKIWEKISEERFTINGKVQTNDTPECGEKNMNTLPAQVKLSCRSVKKQVQRANVDHEVKWIGKAEGPKPLKLWGVKGGRAVGSSRVIKKRKTDPG